MKMSYPFTWSPVSEEWESKRREVFEFGSNQLKNQICSPFGVCAPEPMIEASKKIYDFKVRPDDIWILTFPKCGTTWTQVRPQVIY